MVVPWGAEKKIEDLAHRGPPTGLNRSRLEPKLLRSVSLSLSLSLFSFTWVVEEGGARACLSLLCFAKGKRRWQPHPPALHGATQSRIFTGWARQYWCKVV